MHALLLSVPYGRNGRYPAVGNPAVGNPAVGNPAVGNPVVVTLSSIPCVLYPLVAVLRSVTLRS